jgi:hypothetical protein
MTMVSEDNDKEVQYGIALLGVFAHIDNLLESGAYTEAQAEEHRARICREMRSVLYLLKPYNQYRSKYKSRTENQYANRNFYYRG